MESFDETVLVLNHDQELGDEATANNNRISSTNDLIPRLTFARPNHDYKHWLNKFPKLVKFIELEFCKDSEKEQSDNLVCSILNNIEYANIVSEDEINLNELEDEAKKVVKKEITRDNLKDIGIGAVCGSVGLAALSASVYIGLQSHSNLAAVAGNTLSSLSTISTASLAAIGIGAGGVAITNPVKYKILNPVTYEYIKKFSKVYVPSAATFSTSVMAIENKEFTDAVYQGVTGATAGGFFALGSALSILSFGLCYDGCSSEDVIRINKDFPNAAKNIIEKINSYKNVRQEPPIV